MVPIQVLLILLALLVTVASGVNKAPLWPAVLLLSVADLLRFWPA